MMLWIVLLFCFWLILLVVHLINSVNGLRTLLVLQEFDHTHCLSVLAQYTSDEHAAQVLREAAKDWDSAEEEARIDTVNRRQYRPGGPSVPALWLNGRADTLSSRPVVEEYNHAGERFTTDG